MPGYTVAQLNDLLLSALPDQGRDKWTMIGTRLQKYHFMPNILRREANTSFDGRGYQWNVQTALGGTARARPLLFGNDTVTIPNTMKQASGVFKRYDANSPMDQVEVALNSGAMERIYNIFEQRRKTTMLDLAVLLESDFWQGDTTSGNTGDILAGVPCWIVKSATAATYANNNGFNGGNPTGWTSGVGGLSSSTYDMWRNYADAYTAVTKDDLITKMRRMATMTDFEPPIDIPQYAQGQDVHFYSGYNPLGTVERLVENQNQSLGNDVASKDGLVIFRGKPWEYVPQLDSDTTYPVYKIHWGSMQLAVKDGWNLAESVREAPNDHTSVVHWIDLVCNVMCYDRRVNGVISNGT